MILSAHQSHYLPWLGYLDKIDRSDVFVVLDDVQYEKNGWQNRNRIRTPRGWQWLTVPVHAHLSDRILEVRVSKEISWQKDHSKSLELSYHKAPHFQILWELLGPVYQKEWLSLVDVNLAALEAVLDAIGMGKKEAILSSSIGLKSEATQRLVDLCRHFKADTYLSGDGAHAYLDVTLFEKAGIRVAFQDFSHPVYKQLHGDESNFMEGLSAVDLIFNHGKESLAILRSTRRKK